MGVWAYDAERTGLQKALGAFLGGIGRRGNAFRISARNAARFFRRPPAFGPISSLRRAAGVRSTVLGSFDLAVEAVRAGEATSEMVQLVARADDLVRQVFRPGEFSVFAGQFYPTTPMRAMGSVCRRPATFGQYALYVGHQWLLDDGLDGLVSTGGKGWSWFQDSLAACGEEEGLYLRAWGYAP